MQAVMAFFVRRESEPGTLARRIRYKRAARTVRCPHECTQDTHRPQPGERLANEGWPRHRAAPSSKTSCP
jgi:hypothetical protein